MSTFQKWWFVFSIIFSYWFYISSLHLLRGIRKRRRNFGVFKSFRLEWIGVLFVLAQIAWLYPVVIRHGFGVAPFIWLCIHGIFAFMIGERVLALFRQKRKL